MRCIVNRTGHPKACAATSCLARRNQVKAIADSLCAVLNRGPAAMLKSHDTMWEQATYNVAAARIVGDARLPKIYAPTV